MSDKKNETPYDRAVRMRKNWGPVIFGSVALCTLLFLIAVGITWWLYQKEVKVIHLTSKFPEELSDTLGKAVGREMPDCITTGAEFLNVHNAEDNKLLADASAWMELYRTPETCTKKNCQLTLWGWREITMGDEIQKSSIKYIADLSAPVVVEGEPNPWLSRKIEETKIDMPFTFSMSMALEPFWEQDLLLGTGILNIPLFVVFVCRN